MNKICIMGTQTWAMEKLVFTYSETIFYDYALFIIAFPKDMLVKIRPKSLSSNYIEHFFKQQFSSFMMANSVSNTFKKKKKKKKKHQKSGGTRLVAFIIFFTLTSHRASPILNWNSRNCI